MHYFHQKFAHKVQSQAAQKKYRRSRNWFLLQPVNVVRYLCQEKIFRCPK